MRGTALRVAVLVTITVLGVSRAVAAPSSGAAHERRLSDEEAAAIAVNDLAERGAGYRLRHPRRLVDFTPDGVTLEGRRGAPEWRWALDRIGSSTGRDLVDPHPVAPVAVEQTLIRYDRCILHEEYRLKPGSVEQLLVIPEPLTLEGGDLVVEGSVACEGELAEDESGWRWRGPRGEVTMGRVSVLDAEGSILPATLEVTATSTRLVVDGLALLTAVYPVVVDPELGSNDYRISNMGPDGNIDYAAVYTAVAYNSVDDTYVVVWAGEDDTGGLVDSEFEIFGQVLRATGVPLGPNVRISFAGGTGSTAADAVHPDVAFNPVVDEFLVVWSADNPEDGCVDNEYEIWGQVLDPALNPVFGGNFRISFNGGSGDAAIIALRPAVVNNPELGQYLVVWESDDTVGGMVDGEYEIFAQRLASMGDPLGSSLRVSDMGGSGDPLYGAFDADVVFDNRNDEYLIVWEGDDNTGGLVDNEYEIFGQLITWNGLETGPNDFRISDMGGTGDVSYDAFEPSAAYNSLRNEYLVAWSGDDNVGGVVEGEFEVFCQRFTPDLVGLGPNDHRISDVGGVGDPTWDVLWGPDVAYSPILDQYMVVWGGEDSVGGVVDGEWEIFAQMVNGDVTDGIGPNDERISDVGGTGETAFTAQYPVVAANTWNGQFLVAWNGDDNVGTLVLGEFEIFTQRMDGMAVLVGVFESGDTTEWSSVVP